jgi:hypothetical protein
MGRSLTPPQVFREPDSSQIAVRYPSKRAGTREKRRTLLLISGWWYAREQYASFSIAEVEAVDTKGVNVALLSRGAGATVSSTYYGDGLSGEEHDLYWPIHCDLGDKWVRVNYWESVLQWCY